MNKNVKSQIFTQIWIELHQNKTKSNTIHHIRSGINRIIEYKLNGQNTSRIEEVMTKTMDGRNRGNNIKDKNECEETINKQQKWYH